MDSLDKEKLLKLKTIQKELTQRVKNDPLKYFWPHTKNCDGTQCKDTYIQFETFDGRQHVIRGCPQYTYLNSKADTTAYFGSNRAGKTTTNVVKLCFLTTGRYPDWYVGKVFNRPTKGRIFVEDYGNACRVVTDKLKEWLPSDCYIQEPRRNNLGALVEWYIKHKSGGVSYVDIMTFEQKVEAAEGSDQDFIIFDEPPPRSLYIAATRGLIDRDGICMFGLTPLKEPWIFDEVYNSTDKNVSSVICDMRHNLERWNPLSQRMIGLKESSIQKFEKKLTEEERETRMHGKFRYLSGRIWKEWDRDVHTFDRSFWMEGKDNVIVDGQPPTHWPRIMIIDPHDRNPHAVLWVACDENNHYWAYREAWLANTLIDEAVRHIKQVEVDAQERIQMRIIDPNFGPKKYANRGLTVRDEFEQSARRINYPMRFAFGDDRKEIGRKEVARLLKFDVTKPISFINHPRMRFARDLKECIYQIEHYIWDEFKHNVNRDPKEKPREVSSHFPDNLHYLALSKFGWHKPHIKEGRGRLYESTHK